MTQAATTAGQLSLFAELGVETLPVGMADLTAKQSRFVVAYLRTGLAATAAREAGYSDPEADAAKIRRCPAVAAVLNQACRSAAGNATALAAGMWQRMQAYRAEWEALYPELRTMRTEDLPADEEARALHLARLRFLEDRERQINAELAKIETTLKGIEIKVDGSLEHHHTHAVLTPQLAQELAQARREALPRGN